MDSSSGYYECLDDLKKKVEVLTEDARNQQVQFAIFARNGFAPAWKIEPRAMASDCL